MSPYSYNSSNELTSTPSATYTYDYNGNTLTKTDSTGTTSYSWDYENRLKQVTLPALGGTVNFKYDPFGRRIQKSGTLGTTNYLYDGRSLLEEVDQNGNVLARYTQSRRIDEPLAELRSGTTSYYEADGLGSVTSLSNGTGAMANTYTYDAFGKLTATTGTLTNPFQYTGREFDSETGIYEYRSRYYDQGAGRFITEDPIGFGGGINFYRYVLNNPTNFSDPFGLQTTTTGPVTAPYPDNPTSAEVDAAVESVEAASAGGGAAAAAATAGVAVLDVGLAWYDYNQFRKLCTASGWSWCSNPPPEPEKSCSKKSKKECTDRRNQEMDFCNEQYSNYPNLLRKCRARATERWNACLRGIPDPGPPDPVDPTWSPD